MRVDAYGKIALKSEEIRYIGVRKGATERALQKIVEAYGQHTFNHRGGCGEKRVKITVLIEEID